MADPFNPEQDGAPQRQLDGAAERINEDGSSALDSTRNGRLEHDDVANSPLQQGTDPLGDRAIERRNSRPTLQLVVFGILALVFAYFFVSDLINGEWLKAILGAVVLGICALAINRELRGGRRD